MHECVHTQSRLYDGGGGGGGIAHIYTSCDFDAYLLSERVQQCLLEFWMNVLVCSVTHIHTHSKSSPSRTSMRCLLSRCLVGRSSCQRISVMSHRGWQIAASLWKIMAMMELWAAAEDSVVSRLPFRSLTKLRRPIRLPIHSRQRLQISRQARFWSTASVPMARWISIAYLRTVTRPKSHGAPRGGLVSH